MIRNSFIFLDKARLKTEQNIWKQGIKDWDDFLDANKIKGLSKTTKAKHDFRIKEVRQRLAEEDAGFLASAVPHSEHWRLYETFRDDAAFLDIETKGGYGDITVIGIYDSYSTKTMIRGINLDKRMLLQELAKYKMIITFNGRAFDVPVIEKYFGIRLNILHVDLMHVCRKAGLTGGLKNIERELGIKRPESIKYVSGNDAAELWRCWKATGDRDFLQMLVTYNEEDVINLKTIADRIIPILKGRTMGFS